jgi:hypothetical protein
LKTLTYSLFPVPCSLKSSGIFATNKIGLLYRPYFDDKQKKYYSGKKKNHTLKNQIITTEKGIEIVDVIVGKRGPESDINLLIKQQKNFDKEQKFQGDKGYQGAQRTMTPKKSRENKKCRQK